MDIFTEATAISIVAVTIVTQIFKYIPVEWTTKFAVWINIALSVIASGVAYYTAYGTTPAFNGDWRTFLGQLLIIVVGAALTYELVVKSAVTKPKGNLPADKAV